MAKRAARGRGSARRAAAQAGATADPRQRVVDALMRLMATRRYPSIGLGDIAVEADMTLAEVRALYDGKLAIVDDFSKGIDQAVLDRGPAEGEGPRDRLFDILMRRLDALAPHKAALRRLARAGWCDPGLACGLTRIVRRSMTWMLAGAGIHHGGITGKIVVRGTVLVIGEAMNTWFDDDDPGLAKTMAALDRALRRGERTIGLISEICGLAAPFTGRWSPRRRTPPETAV